MLINKHHSKGGRNFSGRITTFHRGGGHKRRGRWINFKYTNTNSDNQFISNELKLTNVKGVKYQDMNNMGDSGKLKEEFKLTYDPMRGGLVGFDVKSSRLVLVNKEYNNGGVLKTVYNNEGYKLGDLSSHTNIYNIELEAGKGGQLVRAPGVCATIVNHVGGYTRIRLPSGEQRLIPSNCKCSLGIVGGAGRSVQSKEYHKDRKGKAGRSRWLGKRPTVRGTARNPVDHPHGGGQGKTSGGRPSVTPWSVPKGVRTTSNKGAKFVVISRRAASGVDLV